jgi:hypothetical protein
MTTRASGTFDVKLNPITPYNTAEGSLAGRRRNCSSPWSRTPAPISSWGSRAR